MSTTSMNNTVVQHRKHLLRIGLTVFIAVGLIGIVVWKRDALKQAWGESRQAKPQSSVKSSNDAQSGRRRLFELVPDKADTFRLVGQDLSKLGINIFTVGKNPPPSKLKLQGSLAPDPNRFVRVHPRFAGEVRRVAPAEGKDRPLQFGDKVSTGQLLLTIWSKDIGEKKSELVDAISRAHFHKVILDRLKGATDLVSKRSVVEAQGVWQSDVLAIEKAERTLRSWNLTDVEIEAVRKEAREIVDLIQELKGTDHVPDKDNYLIQQIVADDRSWAELDIIAPMNGEILEKNFNVGDMVDTSKVLLKIGDMDRLWVMANVFEEDVPALLNLPKEEWKWSLELKSDSTNTAILDRFDQIGVIVDPNMHTLPVIGYIDNAKRRLAIGQFITATIDIPGDPAQVVIPVSAVVEEGSKSTVFVETDAERREYSRRQVAVVSRGRTMIHVAVHPASYEVERGSQPLLPGDRVLVNSVVELDAELNDLISSAPEQ